MRVYFWAGTPLCVSCMISELDDGLVWIEDLWGMYTC